MRRTFKAMLWVAALAAAFGQPAPAADAPRLPPALRVCADPDNLPFSHSDGSGFENRIARLVADTLGLPLEYEWLPDRRAFVRKTLGARLCDVIIGVPVEFERTMPTLPYYRSAFVIVERDGMAPPLRSFDDPRLPQLRIGIQLIGNDLAASPPGYALARHGAIDKVTGVTLAGEQPPAARLVGAVAAGALDAAILWGPQAGLFVQRSPVPLRMLRAERPSDLDLPFEFSIGMGLRREDKDLRDALNAVIRSRQADIDRILADYRVPLLPMRPMPEGRP